MRCSLGAANKRRTGKAPDGITGEGTLSTTEGPSDSDGRGRALAFEPLDLERLVGGGGAPPPSRPSRVRQKHTGSGDRERDIRPLDAHRRTSIRPERRDQVEREFG